MDTAIGAATAAANALGTSQPPRSPYLDIPMSPPHYPADYHKYLQPYPSSVTNMASLNAMHSFSSAPSAVGTSPRVELSMDLQSPYPTSPSTRYQPCSPLSPQIRPLQPDYTQPLISTSCQMDYANHYQNAMSLSDIMLENQHMDMTASDRNMMPWFQHLPQDFQSSIDWGSDYLPHQGVPQVLLPQRPARSPK